MSELTCEQLEDLGAELALGVLPELERSAALGHLYRCPACRREVEILAGVGDRLLELVPGSEPPAGFDQRVMDRLARQGTGARRVRRWRRPVAVAAAVAVAFGLGGWLVGRDMPGGDGGHVAAPARGGQVAGIVQAELVRGSVPVGQLVLYPGQPGWVQMTVGAEGIGGRVTCELLTTGGGVITIGSFTLVDGRGSWGTPLPAAGTDLAGARLVGPGGAVVATARWAPVAHATGGRHY